jgi:MoxR-like ATPase
MRNTARYKFRGEQDKEPYVASPALVQAVNLAIYLHRPLLLEGEAGCGKTRLAHAVAGELELPLYIWHVRSTSKAQEGLYDYDAILRLHDVHTYQLEKQRSSKTTQSRGRVLKGRDPKEPRDYRRLGPIGKAFSLQDRPAVVLIDEIDKADLDFPNDLLSVLDAPWSFEIPETGEVITASNDCRPIVIITSNKEKGNLPAPFLRRCLYHFVEFPDNEQRLKEIVEKHYAIGKQQMSPELVKLASQRFLSLRKDGALFKKPGISEFLDWLKSLHGFSARPETLKLDEQERVPFPEALFKLRADWQRYVMR